jgi:hypothetical protein
VQGKFNCGLHLSVVLLAALKGRLPAGLGIAQPR